MTGVSPRYVRNVASTALVAYDELSPAMLLKKLDEGLANNPLISDDKERRRYRGLLNEVRAEYENIAKAEVQAASASDPLALTSLFSNYVDNVRAYMEQQTNAADPKKSLVNEHLMRSIEERIDIPEMRKYDFRRELLNHIRTVEERAEEFSFASNPRLHRALMAKLFEDQKDVLKLCSRSPATENPEVAARIERIRESLMKHFGYSKRGAEDLMTFVSGIFARGDVN